MARALLLVASRHHLEEPMSRRWILFAFTIITLSAMTTSRAHAACSANSDCKGSRVCQAGRCVDAGGCSKDSDCPGDQICFFDTCNAPEEEEE